MALHPAFKPLIPLPLCNRWLTTITQHIASELPYRLANPCRQCYKGYIPAPAKEPSRKEGCPGAGERPDGGSAPSNAHEKDAKVAIAFKFLDFLLLNHPQEDERNYEPNSD